MVVVICYDITNDRRRARVASLLESGARRVQYSVFEYYGSEAPFLKLKREMEKLIDMEVDSIRYYYLCSRCASRIEVSGTGPLYGEENVIIV